MWACLFCLKLLSAFNCLYQKFSECFSRILKVPWKINKVHVVVVVSVSVGNLDQQKCPVLPPHYMPTPVLFITRITLLLYI